MAAICLSSSRLTAFAKATARQEAEAFQQPEKTTSCYARCGDTMSSRHLLAVSAVVIATCSAFVPVFGNGFVNWDDPWTLQNNQHLGAAGVLQWAFTTREMGHYQPLAWLVWSGTKAIFGLDPAVFHGLSLIGHLLNVGLVYFLCVRLAAAAGLGGTNLVAIGVVGSFVFGVHPIRVEAVAWASAFPYVLSLAFLLASLHAYLSYCRSDAGRGWLSLSGASYALSQLTRASALAFPFVLLLIDWYPLRRRHLLDKVPFFAIALGAAIAESNARELATLQDVGLGARLTMAAVAPFVYLKRTLLPLNVSPLDPLPIAPRVDWTMLVLGLAGLALITGLLWRRVRNKWPALTVAWASYLLLLAPAVGLTPSGQQATADRYMYVPGVVGSLVIGVVAMYALRDARARSRLRWLATLAVGAATGLTVATWQQTMWWHDSIALWTRAADLNPRNDIATYNLAIALAESGREEDAIARYEQTLRLVPDHEFASHNLNLLRATQAEREGDRLTETGNLDAAIDAYARALAADATRLHARAARGLVLVQRGRFAEAASDLRVAFNARMKPDAAKTVGSPKEDVGVANALAFALLQTGRDAEAASALTAAMRRYPDDDELAHNLARLLATTSDAAVRNGTLALRLALAVRDRTGGRDPRVLDTLAAAYAVNGQIELARVTLDEAAQIARQRGDLEMASEIEAHARRYDPPRVRR
jgi:tetratricopeptide (TPR) repeat protein